MRKFVFTIFVSVFLFGLDATAQTRSRLVKRLILSPFKHPNDGAIIGSELWLHCDERSDNYCALDASTGVIEQELADPSTQAIAACKLVRYPVNGFNRWNLLTIHAPRTQRPYGLRTLHAATRRITRGIVRVLPPDFEFVDQTGLFNEGNSIFKGKI